MTHHPGETVIFRYTHKVYNDTTEVWDLTDCDADYPVITVTNPDAVKRVDAQEMTKISTGKYIYVHTIASDEVAGILHGEAEGRSTQTYGAVPVVLKRYAEYNVEVEA